MSLVVLQVSLVSFMWKRGFLAETEGNPSARALPKPLTVDHITPVYGPWAKATLPSPDVGKWEQ